MVQMNSALQRRALVRMILFMCELCEILYGFRTGKGHSCKVFRVEKGRRVESRDFYLLLL